MHGQTTRQISLGGGGEGDPDTSAIRRFAEDISIQLQAGFDKFDRFSVGNWFGRDEAHSLSIKNRGLLHHGLSGEHFVDSQNVTDSVIWKLELDGGCGRGWILAAAAQWHQHQQTKNCAQRFHSKCRGKYFHDIIYQIGVDWRWDFGLPLGAGREKIQQEGQLPPESAARNQRAAHRWRQDRCRGIPQTISGIPPGKQVGDFRICWPLQGPRRAAGLPPRSDSHCGQRDVKCYRVLGAQAVLDQNAK